MLLIEPFELHSVVVGSVRLDGGAMFGVVPRILWSSKADSDAQGRIRLATRTLLAIDRRNDRVILVDTGCGNKWAPELAARFDVRYDADAIPAALRAAGLSEDAVTDVIITHLHFDHSGGLTIWEDDPDGPALLRYPRARHWLHRQHLDHAQRPHRKDRASFLAEDFSALLKSDGLRLVEGDEPDAPFEGMAWFVSQGHTPYQLHPVFGSAGERLLFVGDLVPTLAHLTPAWVMAYDVKPMTTIDEKLRVYERCIRDGWLLAFPHDPDIGGVALGGRVSRPIVTRTLSL